MNDEYKEVPTRAEFEIILKELKRQGNLIDLMGQILHAEKEQKDDFQGHYLYLTTSANISFAIQDSLMDELAEALGISEIDMRIKLLERACIQTEESVKKIPENAESPEKDFRTSMEYTLYGLKKKLEAMKKYKESERSDNHGEDPELQRV